MSSPTIRLSIASIPVTIEFSASALAWRFCLRLNVRSWRVSPAARVCGVANLHDLGGGVVVFTQLVEHVLRVREDHREDVVEVVRDAAGEATDRLHLLCVPQLLLDATGARHVECDAEHAAPSVHHERVDRDVDVEDRAVLAAMLA